MKQDIELHIGQLVLHGFDNVDRIRIGEAVKSELTRLISEQGVGSSLDRGGEFSCIDGGTFNLSPNAKSEVIGTQVAQSVYKGFNK